MTKRRARLLDPLLRSFRRLTAEPRRLLKNDVAPGERISFPNRIMLAFYLLVKSIYESDISVRAASTAYTFVFSLIPLVTTTLAFFTALPWLQDKRETVKSYLFHYLLPGAVSEVEAYLDQFSDAAAAAGAVASLIFVASILLLFRSLENTFNLIWQVLEARTWGERLKVLAVFFLVGALAITGMLALSREAQEVAQAVADLTAVGISPFLRQIGFGAGELLTAWLIFITANKVFPNTRVNWSAAFFGGALAGTIWHFSKGGFSWYISDVASYDNIYGAVGAVPVFFLWLYLTIILLLGGAYAAYVWQNLLPMVTIHGASDRCGSHQAYYALMVLATIARAFRERKPQFNAQDIAERLELATYFVTRALKSLQHAGVVASLPHARGTLERWVLTFPADSLSLGEVVWRISGEDLEVLEVEKPTPLQSRLAEIFNTAHTEEGSILNRTHVADLEELAPGYD